MRIVNHLVMLIALSISLLTTAEAAGVKRWGPEYFTNAIVYDQNGTALHFYDDVIKGKIVVVSFIFAKCKDLCPLTTARLAEVRHRLGNSVGRDVYFVSITIDPENDTPAVLKAYAEPFDIGAGWQFLTGSPEVIKEIRNKLGELSRKKSEHTAEVLLGNDRHERPIAPGAEHKVHGPRLARSAPAGRESHSFRDASFDPDANACAAGCGHVP